MSKQLKGNSIFYICYYIVQKNEILRQESTDFSYNLRSYNIIDRSFLR